MRLAGQDARGASRLPSPGRRWPLRLRLTCAPSTTASRAAAPPPASLKTLPPEPTVSPRRATPSSVASLSPGTSWAHDALPMGPTAKDLSAMPPGRSRAVRSGMGGALLLALLAAGTSWLSQGSEPVTPTPRPLTEEAVAATSPLRDVPAALAPWAALAPAPEAQPASAGAMPHSSTQGSEAHDVQLAGGQNPTLPATSSRRTRGPFAWTSLLAQGGRRVASEARATAAPGRPHRHRSRRGGPCVRGPGPADAQGEMPT